MRSSMKYSRQNRPAIFGSRGGRRWPADRPAGLQQQRHDPLVLVPAVVQDGPSLDALADEPESLVQPNGPVVCGVHLQLEPGDDAGGAGPADGPAEEGRADAAAAPVAADGDAEG